MITIPNILEHSDLGIYPSRRCPNQTPKHVAELLVVVVKETLQLRGVTRCVTLRAALRIGRRGVTFRRPPLASNGGAPGRAAMADRWCDKE